MGRLGPVPLPIIFCCSKGISISTDIARGSVCVSRLRTMLLLRALLDTVGALSGDLVANIATVVAMFPLPSVGSPAVNRLSASPAGRTAALAARQLAIHQRLWAMSEGYTTNDTRTVRSVSVSELDDMYDIVQEACSSNLFALRGAAEKDDAATGGISQLTSSDSGRGRRGSLKRRKLHNPHDQDVSTSKLEYANVGTAPVGVSENLLRNTSDFSSRSAATVLNHRRLLLDALSINCTLAELQYFWDKLPAEMQQQWRDLSRDLRNT